MQPRVLANTVLFQDDFNDGDANGWEKHTGGGSWQMRQLANSNFVYEGMAVSPAEAPYSVNGEDNWTDYIFEVDIRAIQGVNKPVLFRYRKLGEHYGIDLVSHWGAGDPNNSNIINLHKSSTYTLPNHANDYYVSFDNYPNTWYRLKIIVVNINQNTTNIKVYVKDLDNSIDYGLVLEYSDDYYPITNGKIALLTWPGGYQGDGSPTTTQFDNIVVSSLTPSPSPTPIPSPNPIILLLGLGASWNHEAMIVGNTKPPEEWYMTPFVKAYDGFIQTLKNTGYEEAGPDRNLFVFNYDWRQPIETIANQLENYIENTVDPPSESKIDLVGHSLGGMVARTYVQNNSDHQVDQLITIGSPHKGAPKVYYLWEGADLKRTLTPWQRIGAGILLHLNKRGFQNNVETIRNIIPVLKDLLPTFPYLKHDGSEKPLSEMSQRNNWLEGFNQLPLPGFLTSVLNTILGVKENSTLRWINIEDRNRFDRFLGRWEDGNPVGEEFNNGDETVLVESAQIEGANVIELSGLNHGDLVETAAGQEEIIDLLKLSPSDIISAPEVTYEPSLIFQLASPVSMTIYGPEDWQVGEGVVNNIPNAIYLPEDKFIFIPNPLEGDYDIWVNPENSGGLYRLLVGKITEEGDSWTEFSGEVIIEPEDHTISFSIDPQQNKLELLNEAKESLEDAKNSAKELPKPLRILLVKAIEKRIRQVDEIITLLEKNRENQAQIKTRQVIFSLSILEKNLQIWTRIFEPLSEIQNELRIAKDYLLQVYEFE